MLLRQIILSKLGRKIGSQAQKSGHVRIQNPLADNHLNKFVDEC